MEGTTPTQDDLARLIDVMRNLAAELGALLSWSLSFVPDATLCEVGRLRGQITSYAAAAEAVHSLDTLMEKPWRTPREHVAGDLALLIDLIDIRLREDRGDAEQLTRTRERLVATLELEQEAAERRRRAFELGLAALEKAE